MQFFIDSILYSYAQIFFSNRKWFGGAAMAATFVIPEVGFMGLLGVAWSNLIAFWLKFDKDKIQSGFYGFNGILFGAAAAFYFELDPLLIVLTIIFLVITFFISAVLEHYLASAFNLPGLSLPFILSLYIFIIFLTNYNNIGHSSFLTVSALDLQHSLPPFLTDYLRALSLILFQPNVISGLILAAAILFFSRVLFVLSITAFTLNMIFINAVIPDASQGFIVYSGLNAILTAFALGGSLIIPSRKSFLLVVLSTLMVVIMTGFFIRFFINTPFPVLVLPFNFIVLSVIYSLKFRKESSGLVLLYFKPGSPEENYYYHTRRKARFDRFKFIFPELPFMGEWYVSQGFNGEFTHKDDWKYAWDFVIRDEDQREFSGDGVSLSDYFCYRLPVTAALDGEVVKVVDGIPDNLPGEININQNWGNTVILSHEYGLFSSVSHLQPDTIKVKEGDRIKKGEIIAFCGNSGRSPVPHLHFQFQATDKLGDSTYLFPFAHYVEKSGDSASLKTFDYPAGKGFVKNLEIHKILKSAFNFKLGDKFCFNTNINGNTFEEEWEVKIDMTSLYYIHSSKGASAYFYLTEKVFYFTDFFGERNSALYYFFLSAMQVPFSYWQKLGWTENYSLAHLPGINIRYLSEFFLLFKNSLNSTARFMFEETVEEEKKLSIRSEIQVRGENIFSWYEKDFNGSVKINTSGDIDEIDFKDNGSLSVIIKKLQKECVK
jgi:urea transporter